MNRAYPRILPPNYRNMIAYSPCFLQQTRREKRNWIHYHTKVHSHLGKNTTGDKASSKPKSRKGRIGDPANTTQERLTQIFVLCVYFLLSHDIISVVTFATSKSTVSPAITNRLGCRPHTAAAERPKYYQAFDRNGFLPSQSG